MESLDSRCRLLRIGMFCPSITLPCCKAIAAVLFHILLHLVMFLWIQTPIQKVRGYHVTISKYALYSHFHKISLRSLYFCRQVQRLDRHVSPERFTSDLMTRNPFLRRGAAGPSIRTKEKMYIGGIGLEFPSEVPEELIAQPHTLVQTPLLDKCHVG